jgi:hypothetical protein
MRLMGREIGTYFSGQQQLWKRVSMLLYSTLSMLLDINPLTPNDL